MVALSRAIQPKHAMEMLLTGEQIDASSAMSRPSSRDRAVASTSWRAP